MKSAYMTVVVLALTSVSLSAGLALDLELAHLELPGLELLEASLPATLSQLPLDGALEQRLGGLVDGLPLALVH